MTPFCAARCKYATAVLRGHPRTESVFVCPLTPARLECTLHNGLSNSGAVNAACDQNGSERSRRRPTLKHCHCGSASIVGARCACLVGSHRCFESCRMGGGGITAFVVSRTRVLATCPTNAVIARAQPVGHKQVATRSRIHTKQALRDTRPGFYWP